jgi:hypothetical protein
MPIVILAKIYEITGLALIHRSLERPTCRVATIVKISLLDIIASFPKPDGRFGTNAIGDDVDLTRFENFQKILKHLAFTEPIRPRFRGPSICRVAKPVKDVHYLLILSRFYLHVNRVVQIKSKTIIYD